MRLLRKTRFGPAGYPDEAGGRAERVFALLKELRLDALEYAAVYGLRLSREKAELIGRLAAATDVTMSMHAAYYISLLSRDRQVQLRSMDRLVQALEYSPLMGVKRVIFHVGGYCGRTPEDAYAIVRDALTSVWDRAGTKSGGALLFPEIAGKISAFGSPEELIRLCSETKGCMPALDWAHLYARSQGQNYNRSDCLSTLTKFENELGSAFVDTMHFHVSGIVFGDKGESEHRPLGEAWGPDILPLVEAVRERGYKPTFISETPEPVRGALYVKNLWEYSEVRRR